jgi:hypothetical protein
MNAKYRCPICKTPYDSKELAGQCECTPPAVPPEQRQQATLLPFRYTDGKGSERTYTYVLPQVKVEKTAVGPWHFWVLCSQGEERPRWCQLPLPVSYVRKTRQRFNLKDGQWVEVELPEDYAAYVKNTWFSKDSTIELFYKSILGWERRKLYTVIVQPQKPQ